MGKANELREQRIENIGRRSKLDSSLGRSSLRPLRLRREHFPRHRRHRLPVGQGGPGGQPEQRQPRRGKAVEERVQSAY